MAKFNDLTGKLFGRLTAVERLPPHGKNTASMWACKCECGGTAIVRGTDLVNGHTMSCGCYRKMQKAMPAGGNAFASYLGEYETAVQQSQKQRLSVLRRTRCQRLRGMERQL